MATTDCDATFQAPAKELRLHEAVFIVGKDSIGYLKTMEGDLCTVVWPDGDESCVDAQLVESAFRYEKWFDESGMQIIFYKDCVIAHTWSTKVEIIGQRVTMFMQTDRKEGYLHRLNTIVWEDHTKWTRPSRALQDDDAKELVGKLANEVASSVKHVLKTNEDKESELVALRAEVHSLRAEVLSLRDENKKLEVKKQSAKENLMSQKDANVRQKAWEDSLVSDLQQARVERDQYKADYEKLKHSRSGGKQNAESSYISDKALQDLLEVEIRHNGGEFNNETRIRLLRKWHPDRQTHGGKQLATAIVKLINIRPARS